jgi:hypothetical protein
MKTFGQCVAMGLLTLAACGGSDKMDNGTTPSAATTAAGSSSPAASGGSGNSAAQASAGRAGGAPASSSSTATGGQGGAAAQSMSSSPTSAGSGGQPASGGTGGAALAAASGAGGTSAAAAGSSAGGAPAATGDCDRACLMMALQGYLDALVAKDPAKLKVSADVRYTENGKEIKLGEGLWKTASMMVADERLDFADPTLHNATSQVVINENGSTPVIYMVRLKIPQQEITEIESMAVRRGDAANGFFNTMAMKPEAVFLQKIDKPMSREDLTAITEKYLDYLEGKKGGMEVPFDAGCKRYENGQVTASGLSSFNAQSWGFQVTHRILVIDEEAGITWGMFPFMQSATALVVGEAFKIIDGKIMMIQAVMANQPAKVWDDKM